VEDDKILEKVPMSDEQFAHYLQQRWVELRMDSQKGKKSMDENLGSYRVLSRLACNYAVPGELRVTTGEEVSEDKVADKPEVLAKLKENPEKYLTEKALKVLSPKFLKGLAEHRHRHSQPLCLLAVSRTGGSRYLFRYVGSEWMATVQDREDQRTMGRRRNGPRQARIHLLYGPRVSRGT
jgi:hypothetical protein